jgi:uncharacterized protein YndB with AHSA1/START domain
MIQIIAIGAGGLIAAVLGIAATRPATFRMQRTATIAAPPEAILPLLTDFRRWADWSPYEKLDPAMKKTFSGAPTGTGAVYEWSGNGKAGMGRMEITDVSPSRVVIDLAFEKPFKARNTTEFTLQPRSGQTEVTWAMYGPNQFMGKVMSVFIDMDKLLAKDFESGLASLKAIAEAQPAGAAS